MAKGIFDKKLEEKGLFEKVIIDSCGTSDFHEGEDADPRTLQTLDSNNVPLDHQARQLRAEDFSRFDYIIAMDEKNFDDILLRKPEDSDAKVLLMREFDNDPEDLNVPDPYWSGEDGFNLVFDTLSEASENFLKFLQKKHNL